MYDAELIRTALKFPPGRRVARCGHPGTVLDVQRDFRKDYVKDSLGGAFTTNFTTLTGAPYYVAVRLDNGTVDGFKPNALTVVGGLGALSPVRLLLVEEVARVANKAFPIGTRVKRSAGTSSGVVVSTRQLPHYDSGTFYSYGGCYVARARSRPGPCPPVRIAVQRDSGLVQAWDVDQIEYASVQPTVAVPPVGREGYAEGRGFDAGYEAGRKDGEAAAEVRVESARREAHAKGVLEGHRAGWEGGIAFEQDRLRRELGL